MNCVRSSSRTSCVGDGQAQPLRFGERGLLIDHLQKDLLVDAQLSEEGLR